MKTSQYIKALVFGIALVLNLAMFNKIYAVTASPVPVEFRQPDGRVLTILLKGDEFIHWAVTTDGYTLLSNPAGAYEYAAVSADGRIIFSGIEASDPAKRTAAEVNFLSGIPRGITFTPSQIHTMKQALSGGRTPDASLIGGFPTIGTQKLLVILANFSNTSPTYTQANFDNLMNQVNYNGTGSFKDFYLEVSYGKLIVVSTVTIWVTLPNPHDYYGPNTNWGQFAFDAITAANNQTTVNFADYDNNSDGVVDGISIFHQGRGQEESGNVNDIWSHSWDLTSAGYSAAQRTFDGVLVNAYTTMPERNASSMGAIGVMCHEFGHNLGAPDFYDTDYSSGGQYDGTGCWDVMANGSWNGNLGDKPAHHNAYTKAYIYGWTVPELLSSAQNKTLRNAESYADVVQYSTPTPNEYFLCENRQKTGFDAAVPGHGLILYHVDGSYIASHLATNTVNAGIHQGIYPVCASATANPPSSYGTINGSSCPFPGTGSKTVFSDASMPNSHSWAGVNTGYPVFNIAEDLANKQVSFCFIACSSPDDPGSFTATAASSGLINLSWGLNPGGNAVLVAYNSANYFGSPVAGSAYYAGNTIPGGGTVLYNGNGTYTSHSGLDPNTTYYYKAWSVLPGTSYSPGVTSSATTLCGIIHSFPFTQGFENGGYLPSCWTQEQVSASGINWTFVAGNGGSNPSTAHTGSYNACLRDQSQADNRTKLITPPFNLNFVDNPSLKFWHYQQLWSPDQDQLKIYYKTSSGGAWTLLASYTSNVNSWTERTLSLPNPSSEYYIAFEGDAKYGYGVCIDDVSVYGAYKPTWSGETNSDWNTCTNWTNDSVPSCSANIVIPSGTQITFPVITSSSQSCANLDIQAGAKITINPGAIFTVNGTLTNNSGNAGILIRSDSTGTGSLLHNTANVPGTIERYITGSANLSILKYHFVSVPLVTANASTSSLFQGSYLFDFNESINNWNAYGSSTTASLDETKGFMLYYPADHITYQFAGNMNNGNFAPTLSGINSPGINRGWNLIPNPYPSSIDWKLVTGRSNVDNAIYIWPSDAGPGGSQSSYYSYVGGVSSPPGAMDGVVAVGQSFFVHASSASPSILFNNACRLHGNKPFLKNDSIIPNLFYLQAKSNGVSDFAAIRFAAEATAGFDADLDAYKLSGDEGAPQLSSVMDDGTRLSINSLPQDNMDLWVPLHFEMGSAADVSFTASGLESFSNGVPVFLEDRQQNKLINLNIQPEYNFTHSPADPADRFRLLFAVLCGQQTPGTRPQARVFSSGDRLYAEIPALPNQEMSLYISDALGRQVSKMRVEEAGIIQLPALQTRGVYIFQAVSGSQSWSQKFIY